MPFYKLFVLIYMASYCHLSYILVLLSFRVLNDAAVVIQKNYRGHLARKYFRIRVKVHCIVMYLACIHCMYTWPLEDRSFKHDESWSPILYVLIVLYKYSYEGFLRACFWKSVKEHKGKQYLWIWISSEYKGMKTILLHVVLG